jgi:phosphatidylinositol 4-phosphatase
MAQLYRDINVSAASDCYIFSSPSSPNAPSLTIERPTGELRLSEPSLLSNKRVSRVSSIAGILGVIQLRLGTWRPRQHCLQD